MSDGNPANACSGLRRFVRQLLTLGVGLQGALMTKPHFAAFVAVMSMLLTIGARQATGSELFFHLVEEKLPYERITWTTDLNQLTLTEPPLIAIGDIESYNWATHTIVVTPECGAHLFATFGQRTRQPMITRPFVVSVDSVRIYMGVLNSFLSSWYPMDVPTILMPLDDGIVSSLHIAKAGKGYDERNDTRIRAALEHAGVLFEE